ncbi:hypothetical protein [Cohnella abietis]|uniref:DUF4064 domain-containing protein n=1 Tax=Cohnella abietis TaxID=2507935 RepID=A0A3T1D2H9_9BACL|nr:hypothetical protein [Cohnella abietis]BBI32313.1 hypothetical protein KCTCHS21_17120 [Cohnella abietis]
MSEHIDNHEQFQNKNAFTPIHDQGSIPLKHSKLGIVSFILFLVSVVAFIGVSIGVVILMSKDINFSTMFDSNGELAITEEELQDKFKPLLGYLFLYPLILIINVIGIILGITGLVRTGYKKTFPILGTVFNGLALMAILVLMVIAFAQNNLV